jgi:hypothetical protein
MYIHTKVHTYSTYIQTHVPPKIKKREFALFFFRARRFRFFSRFFSSRSRAFYLASRSRAQKRESAKKARVPSSGSVPSQAVCSPHYHVMCYHKRSVHHTFVQCAITRGLSLYCHELCLLHLCVASYDRWSVHRSFI